MLPLSHVFSLGFCLLACLFVFVCNFFIFCSCSGKNGVMSRIEDPRVVQIRLG